MQAFTTGSSFAAVINSLIPMAAGLGMASGTAGQSKDGSVSNVKELAFKEGFQA
jgi:hypothetical protein